MDTGWIKEETNKGTPHLLHTRPAKPMQAPLLTGKLCIVSHEVTLALVTSEQRVITGRLTYQGPGNLGTPTAQARVWNRQMPQSCSGSAMVPRLLHYVALCLLGAGKSCSERTTWTKIIMFSALCLSFLAATPVSFLTLFLIFHLSMQVPWVPRSPKTQDTRLPG